MSIHFLRTSLPYLLHFALMVTMMGCVKKKDKTTIPPVASSEKSTQTDQHESTLALSTTQDKKESEARAEEENVSFIALPKKPVEVEAEESSLAAELSPYQDEETKKSIEDMEHIHLPSMPEPHKQVGAPNIWMPIEERLVKVSFVNEDLIAMVNHFAALQRINIIPPPSAHALQQKVTFALPHEVSLKEVNAYLDSFLELAGYSRVPHGDIWRIVKTDGQVSREALPLYVNADLSQLPVSEERIRAIYYLKNLRIPDTALGTDSLTVILNDMLSANRSFMYDPRSNAMVIADKANNIKAAMTLILELDAIGTREVIKALPLYNSNAEVIAQMLSAQILAAGGDDGSGGKSDAGKYFASGLRVFADNRTNSLIVMGREAGIERLHDFIREHLDVPADSGESVLHFYDLQYLDAEKFAPVLERIVNEQLSGQSTRQTQGGPLRPLDSVIVRAEKMIAERVEAKKLASSDKDIQSILKGSVFRGGNRIIVTALKRDWLQIEPLIEELDQPKLQIIVQLLLVNFDTTDSRILAAQTRNPNWMQLPKGVAFQAAHITTPILDGPINPSTGAYLNPTTVAADLLRLLMGNISAAGQLFVNSASQNNSTNIGSTIFSFNDPSTNTPGIWSFLQWLQSFGATKVLSHPYLVVENHCRAEELSSTILRVVGPAETGEGGAIATKQVDVEAATKISVVPRASSPDRLNIQVSVFLQQFEGTNANRTTRELHTSVNMGSGETLVIGGLASHTESITEYLTPIIGRIPVIKTLFSSTKKTLRRTNLILFISPTIIQPQSRDGMTSFTRDETHKTYRLMKRDQLLSQFKDPVSYLFFDQGNNTPDVMLDEYLSSGIGDFVFDDVGAASGLKEASCSPCAEEKETMQSKLLRDALASERNPLIDMQEPPEQQILDGK